MKTDRLGVESGSVTALEDESNMATRKRELTKPMSMRLSPEDKRELDDIANLVSTIPRLTIARLALRLGLTMLREDPSLLLGGERPPPPPRSLKTKGRGKAKGRREG